MGASPTLANKDQEEDIHTQHTQSVRMYIDIRTETQYEDRKMKLNIKILFSTDWRELLDFFRVLLPSKPCRYFPRFIIDCLFSIISIKTKRSYIFPQDADIFLLLQRENTISWFPSFLAFYNSFVQNNFLCSEKYFFSLWMHIHIQSRAGQSRARLLSHVTFLRANIFSVLWLLLFYYSWLACLLVGWLAGWLAMPTREWLS